MKMGLVGYAGTGKSTVLSMFADLGARIVSADVIVHELLAQPELQAVIATTLGLEDASSRENIAKRVFSDPAALRALESLVHPLVAEEIDALRRDFPANDVLIYEVPLPPTAGTGERVITVEAPLDVRRQRLQQRGMSATDIDARIAAQESPAEYKRDATYVIENDGSEEHLHNQVARVWEVLQRDARNL